MSDQPSPIADIIVSILMLLVVAPFLATTGDIYIDPSDPGFGARDFPKIVTYLILILTLSLLVKSVFRWFSGHKTSVSKQLNWAEVYPVVSIVGIGLLYVYCISLFQYLLPTFLVLVLMLFFFGSRGMLRLVLVPLLAVVIYYFVFFIILGLYEEPGAILRYDSYSFARFIRTAIGMQ